MTGSLLTWTAEGPPTDPLLLRDLFVDPLDLVGFLRCRYLDSYLKDGGSKLKLLVGREGSGKSHLCHFLAAAAKDLGYITRVVSAGELPLFSFDQIYRQIMTGVDPADLVRKYTLALVKGLGYTYPGQEERFLDWAIAQGRDGRLVSRELQDHLGRDLTLDRDLDRSFATALTLLAADELGMRPLDPAARLAVIAWLQGHPVSARQRNWLQIRKAIDRYSARLIFRSFLHFLPKAGVKGVVLVVDDFHLVTETRPGGPVKYTRTRRDDLYESMRQVIDEVDALKGFLMLLSGRRALLDDEKHGVRSYEALWMRLQNEVRSAKVNRFADLLDLDAIWEQHGHAGLVEIADRLARLAGGGPLQNLACLHEQIKSLDLTVSETAPVRRTVSLVLDASGGRES
ncbi:MAG TPA: hypothetical protein DCM14_07990 [Clostridiales bacterium UBA8153]|nr:hypothetical protein [Clostridiales bacterium UBA8153]